MAGAPHFSTEETELGARLIPALAGALGAKTLLQTSELYTGVFDSETKARLLESLWSPVDELLSSPPPEIVGLLEPLRDFSSHRESLDRASVVLSALVFLHPRTGGLLVSQDGAVVRSALATLVDEWLPQAPARVRESLEALSEIMLFDCLIPNCSGRPEYMDPRRIQWLASAYWERLTRILVIESKAMCGIPPHPLLKLVVSLERRLERCFAELCKVIEVGSARETVQGLIEALLKEPDSLGVCEEWFNERLTEMELFLEQARFRFGAGSFIYTDAESFFLGTVDRETLRHSQRLDEYAARLKAWAVKKKTQMDAEGREHADGMGRPAAVCQSHSPRPPKLMDSEAAVMDALRTAGKALTGKELARKLEKMGVDGCSLGNLTRHVLPRLKEKSLVANRRGAGYYLLGE